VTRKWEKYFNLVQKRCLKIVHWYELKWIVKRNKWIWPMVPKKMTYRGEIQGQYLEAWRSNPFKDETNCKLSIWGLHCFGFCHHGLYMEILGFITRWNLGVYSISGMISLTILAGIFIILENTYYKSPPLFLAIKLECKWSLTQVTLQHCQDPGKFPSHHLLSPLFITRWTSRCSSRYHEPGTSSRLIIRC